MVSLALEEDWSFNLVEVSGFAPAVRPNRPMVPNLPTMMCRCRGYLHTDRVAFTLLRYRFIEKTKTLIRGHPLAWYRSEQRYYRKRKPVKTVSNPHYPTKKRKRTSPRNRLSSTRQNRHRRGLGIGLVHHYLNTNS